MDFSLDTEQKQIVSLLDDLGKKEFAPKTARWDENQEYPWGNVHRLRASGLLGMTIPEAYGGQGRPLIDAILAVETAAKYCGVTARILVETNMGALGCVMAYGSEDQRRLVARSVFQRKLGFRKKS
ncbi:MAG: acyl-CoA dehydrogenase family protein [Desulfatiglandaceae bacterium]